MLHKKDFKEVGFLTAIVLIPLVYDWFQDSVVSWHLVMLWLALSALLVVPKQLLSYASERNDLQVVLRESLFSRQSIINRADISTVELYEVDRQPIGLKILCKDDTIHTFVPVRCDVALLESVRSFILERKT